MRASIAIALALLLAGPATAAVKKGPKPLHVAQMSLTGAGGSPKKAVAGGASIAPLFANGNTGTISGAWTAGSSLTFQSGPVCLAVTQQTGGADSAANSVSVTGLPGGTITATQVGVPTGDAADFMTLWWFIAVAGTGNIVVSNPGGGFQTVAATAWQITGNVSNTPVTANLQDNFTVNHADAQGPLPSITVPSGGVGCFAIGKTFSNAAGLYPVVWSGGPVNDASLQAFSTNANQAAVGGGHIIVPGTYAAIEASATSSTWQFSAFGWEVWQ